MPESLHLENWRAFEDRLKGYFALKPKERSQLFFRGVADADWPLETTLDRYLANLSTPYSREQVANKLVEGFKRETIGVPLSVGVPATPTQWELLARHHGLPSPILDWTRSPYIASFFAFSDDHAQESENVALWVFNRARYFAYRENLVSDERADDPIELLEDYEDFRMNPRAIEQQAVYMHTFEPATIFEGLPGLILSKITMPSTERSQALSELSEMNITAKHMFRDLDSAARSAAHRFADLEA